MNKKAEAKFNFAGIIVITAIALIIGASLLSTVAKDAGKMLNSVSLSNGTYAIGSTIGGKTWLIGQELLSTPVVTNASGSGNLINSGNWTITEGVNPSTGNKGIVYTKLSNDINTSVNISYTYGPEGYIEDSGSRSIVPLIILFFALLIMVIAIVPVLRSGLLEAIGYK